MKTISDYTDKLAKQFPELTKSEVSNIVVFGMRKLQSAVITARQDVRLTDGNHLYIYAGKQTHDEEKRRLYEAKQKFKKAAFVSRQKNEPFMGFYYIGMTSAEYAKYMRNKRKGKQIKLTRRAFTTNIKLLQQIKRYHFILKVKFPFPLQHLNMMDWKADPEDFTLIQIKNQENKWKKLKQTVSEKE